MTVESSSLVTAIPDWGLHCYERRKASERKRRPSLDLYRQTRTDKSPRHSGKSSPSELTEALFTDEDDTDDLELVQSREVDTCAGVEVRDARSIRAAIESDSEPDSSSSPSLEPNCTSSNRPFPAAEDEWASTLHSANQKIKTELAHVKAQQDRARATLRGLLGLPGAVPAPKVPELERLRKQNVRLEQLLVEQEHRGDELETQLDETRSLVDMFQTNMYSCIEDGEAVHAKSENVSRENAQTLASQLTKAENKIVLLDAEKNLAMMNTVQAKAEGDALRKQLEEREKEMELLKQQLANS